jgi:dihydroorotate dehydrogenase (fumarate)
MPPSLGVTYCGLTLPNPFVVAPAAITETADRVRRLEDAGAAAVVMKSYSQHEPQRRHATPRFRILRHRAGPLSADVLYSYEQASVFDLDRYCEEIARCKSACAIPIFASLHIATDDHWRDACRACEQAGADGIELNVSCPHGVQAMSGDEMLPAMARALSVAREATSLPLVPKITPQLDRPDLAALHLAHGGAAAVVMFNRFTGLDIDLDNLRPILHGGYAGHGGPWALHYVLRWLAATYPVLTIPIAASGGAFSADAAIKMILAGATVVEVCSAIIAEGPGVIPRFLSALDEYMDRHSIASLDDIRGVVCERLVPTDEVDRRNRFFAAVEHERCKACGLCARLCIYGAATETQYGFAIDPAACDGCGLCAEMCPSAAISMTLRPTPIDR